jgi:hypothetical protein
MVIIFATTVIVNFFLSIVISTDDLFYSMSNHKLRDKDTWLEFIKNNNGEKCVLGNNIFIHLENFDIIYGIPLSLLHNLEEGVLAYFILQLFRKIFIQTKFNQSLFDEFKKIYDIIINSNINIKNNSYNIDEKLIDIIKDKINYKKINIKSNYIVYLYDITGLILTMLSENNNIIKELMNDQNFGYFTIKELKDLFDEREIIQENFDNKLNQIFKDINKKKIFKDIIFYKLHPFTHGKILTKELGPQKSLSEIGGEKFIKLMKDHSSISSPNLVLSNLYNLMENIEYISPFNFSKNIQISSNKTNIHKYKFPLILQELLKKDNQEINNIYEIDNIHFNYYKIDKDQVLKSKDKYFKVKKIYNIFETTIIYLEIDYYNIVNSNYLNYSKLIPAYQSEILKLDIIEKLIITYDNIIIKEIHI